MDIFHAFILGFVQALTEFIPVSSSGHLIVVREVLGLSIGGLSFDAVLQLATALAVMVYFRRDIASLMHNSFRLLRGTEVAEGDRSLITALIWGTLPAIIAGLLLEEYMETIFRDALLVAAALLFGSLIMLMAEYILKHRVYEEGLTPIKGFVIGLFQCLALVPGVSRSGATISGGLFAGLSRHEAARFSFLLSVPILLGSGMKKLFEIEEAIWLPLFIGSTVAFLVGLGAIHFLMRYVRSHSLAIFIWYRVLLALAIVFFFA